MDAGSFSDGQIRSPACTPCGYTDTVHVQQGAILICFWITTLEIITFVCMAYMIALNVIGVLVVRSATNKDPDFVTKQLMGVMVGLADRHLSFSDRLP